MERRAMLSALVLLIAAGLLLTACGAGPGPSGTEEPQGRLGSQGAAGISAILASSSLVCCVVVLALALGAAGIVYAIRRPPPEA